MATFSVPSPFIQAPLRGAARHGLTQTELFAKCGITEDDFSDDGALPPDAYARLMLMIWRLTGDEAMGLNPEPVTFRTFAMMCRAVITCATLEHAMRRAAEFYRLLPGSPQVALEKDEHRVRLIISHSDQFDPDHFLSESLLVIWHRFGSWLTGQGIPLLKVECPYSAPGHAELYADLFATPVSFDAEDLALTIPARAIRMPVVQSPASLERFLQHSPADILARPNPHQSTSAKVRNVLLGSPVAALPNLTEMAAVISMSGATLRRYLREEGTTYQTLKDEIRFVEASRLLKTSEASVADIAAATGFSETSAFSRAFSRWSGKAPAQYRRNTRTADLPKS